MPDKLFTFPNGLTILQNTLLDSTGLVYHGTSTRKAGFSKDEYSGLNLGYSSGDDKDLVQKNRNLFYQTIGINPTAVYYAKQVHGNHVEVVTGEKTKTSDDISTHSFPSTDAMITNKKNIPLAILTADCIPVFILDKKTPSIGLAHAGWRGTQLQIAAETVKTMMKHFGTKPGNCIAWISVGISDCCYQVGEDIRLQFQAEYGKYINPLSGDKLNLPEINKFQLLQSGIPVESIQISNHCSSHEDGLFYSYRRDGKKSGRMISFFMLT